MSAPIFIHKRFVFLAFLLAVFVLLFLKTYSSFINASASKKELDNPDIFNLVEVPVIEPIKINFQDENTVPPPGWLKDSGEPFGKRAGIYEGSQLEYGWRKRSNNAPLDLSGNGRARIEPEDVLLSTFIHMQADNINTLRYGAFDGKKTEGYWELKVLNGVYKVSVAVGDGMVGKAAENDCINIEGVKAISNFVPIGKLRSPGRFKETTVTVSVSDGYLTIDADGGTNTKLCYADITPISVAPFVYLKPGTQNLLIENGTKEQKKFVVGLHNNLNSDLQYHLSATYSGQTTNWLNFSAENTANDSIIIFDYSKASVLSPGIYYAKIKVSADGYSSTSMDIQLRVVDHNRPYVIASVPVNGARMLKSVTIAANDLSVPEVKGYKGGTDNSTINNNTVKLYKIHHNGLINVQGVVQGTGGGDAISFSPSRPLDPNSSYKFVITDGVKSYSGASFVPFETSFSTEATPVDSTNLLTAEFTKISIPGTQNKKYTSLTFGPDGKFYALKIDGTIERFDVDHTDGMLNNMASINTLVKKYGELTAIGLTFDVRSTAKNLIAYVSYSSSGLNEAPAFDGRISRLSGTNLQNEQKLIMNLPRSTRDHMVNSMAFGPDSALYVSVGSNSSAGRYDKGWQRDETLLAGSILRLDLKKLAQVKLPLDVRTTANQNLINKAPKESITLKDGTYNPYSVNSPLTIYASGIRNGYDLIWHSNGQLYIPANGSGGGGNSPESVKGTRRPNGKFYDGPDIEATSDVPVQHDWLFRVNPNRPVGYFGHPNPLRGEYVINRGYADNPVYDPRVKPDVNYRGAAFDFGFNKSPNGVIEYKSNTFDGDLKGKLLVCRFSGGGDIMVMEPGSMKKLKLANNNNDHIYDIVSATSGASNYGLIGMAGFANPLDITEDVTNGNLYVSEFNWNDNANLISQITLLKAKQNPVNKAIAKTNH
ncbi:hypothetical protein GS399_10010 [Pedobacter sp. HMF7647]|uniref:Uncharacterized protein n=1 Tax=Hufsiella arboris TaxID=2695275 RepID=A0A7K1Y9Q0_9SPHI|nr:PQQ-dependent sugar dehydrogenase [Hufsiella arboris]MXV51302.1 hypothetical protein [Hufsiella arboris]